MLSIRLCQRLNVCLCLCKITFLFIHHNSVSTNQYLIRNRRDLSTFHNHLSHFLHFSFQFYSSSGSNIVCWRLIQQYEELSISLFTNPLILHAIHLIQTTLSRTKWKTNWVNAKKKALSNTRARAFVNERMEWRENRTKNGNWFWWESTLYTV